MTEMRQTFPVDSTEFAAESSEFQNRQVSRWFRNDWNRVIAFANFPVLQPTSAIIAVIPILEGIVGFLPVDLKDAWLLWASSLSFVAAFLLIRMYGPSLILDYPNYGAFESEKHSHRWMLWRFRHSLPTVERPGHLIQETVAKDLAYPLGSARFNAVRARLDPMPVRSHPQSLIEWVDALDQVDRDIYFKFWIKDVAYALPLEENDPKIKEKNKELFWMTFTEYASYRPTELITTWVFLYLGIVLLSITVIVNVLKLFGFEVAAYIDMMSADQVDDSFGFETDYP